MSLYMNKLYPCAGLWREGVSFPTPPLILPLPPLFPLPCIVRLLFARTQLARVHSSDTRHALFNAAYRALRNSARCS